MNPQLDIAPHVRCSECGRIRYRTGPYQCSNGHLICHQCQRVISVCPRCHIIMDRAVPIRCHAVVDIMMDQIQVPCYYKTRGCPQEKMARGAMRAHISTCPYRDIRYANSVPRVAEWVVNNNFVAIRSDDETESPAVVDQDVQPAVINSENEDENPGPAVGDEPAGDQDAEIDEILQYLEDNLGPAVGDEPDDDQNAGVAEINPNPDENDATEENATQDEIVNAEVVDQDVGENQNAEDSPNHVEEVHGDAPEETANVPVVADQAEEGNEGAVDTIDEPNGANEQILNPNGLNGEEIEGTDEPESREGSPTPSERRYASRQRHKTERYTALPFGPTRKRVKSEETAPPPPAPIRKRRVVSKAIRIQPKSRQILKKKNGPGRKRVNRCRVCQRTFLTRQGLGNHKRVHKRVRKQKPRERHPCRLCRLEFPEREHVAEHLAAYHCNQTASFRNEYGISIECHFCLFCIMMYEMHELPDHISTRHQDKF